MLDDRSIQRKLKEWGYYLGKIDGDYGPRSKAAARRAVSAEVQNDSSSWSDARVKVACQQLIMKKADIPVGDIDGLIGPQTRYALEIWQNRLRDIEPGEAEVAHLKNDWPRQRDVADFFGAVGENQTRLISPYPFKLAWNKATIINGFSVHRKVRDSLERILQRTLAHYGLAEINRLNLDLFGGCLNVRKMRGGNLYSMHSWGIAVDLDPDHNKLRWGRDRAWMARRDYQDFVGFWEDEGWLSLGRERNYDWMHFQAARL